MSTVSADQMTESGVTRRPLLLPTLIAAIFVSAALLFAVQPMFTKMVLPRLGGAAAVWSVAPKAIAGGHSVCLLRRIQEADSTLRGLVSELAERGAVKTKQRKTFETWFFRQVRTSSR